VSLSSPRKESDMVLSLVTATTLAFSLHAAPRSPIAAATQRFPAPHMGLFDGLAKAFENKDYSQSPGTYEQTNARASHILVATEEQASKIKDQIAAGDFDFSEAAVKFSTCASASRGGKLGKFVPGSMAKEFDDVVFKLNDTGELNPKNEAALYEPAYGLDEVHGPVQTKFGYHLIKIETRYIADFDFRLKEEGVVEI